MFDPLQSAYREKYSAETALTNVQNVFLSALDAGSSDILQMLDLSAAFDTIGHDILLLRLCNVYGITGNAMIGSCPISSVEYSVYLLQTLYP